MYITAQITTTQVDQIVRRRLMNMIGLGYYAERTAGVKVFIYEGKIMEEDQRECGVRTLRTADELDYKVFDVLAAMERAA
jgi:ribosomal protein S1